MIVTMANDSEMSHLVHHNAPWWIGILLHLCTKRHRVCKSTTYC